MKKIIHDNKGLSLVEILGALVILGILLVAFFTFFTQSAKFTAHNFEKLTAVQVAEDIVGQIRNLPSDSKLSLSMFEECKLPLGSDVIRCRQNTNSEEIGYNIFLNEKKGPENTNLMEIEITVISESGINNPEFKTEMYYENVGGN